ncbi:MULTISPECIES: hypothetical protein [Streptomyces]|uniref:hypothetical protein n=1 Tax=Streptomyces lycopersici TaxID=2974589 RepID=UPI0021D0475A|nr:hypothetical protein [Streptomyces sp. NEAU-383]
MTADGKRIHFPPILNGLDYLESTVALLGPKNGEPSSRDVKYAVLHLQAASETILKARLAIEGAKWVWVFPEKYEEAKHKAGEFRSVGWEDAIKRIKDRCAPETEIGPKRAYRALANMRNRFQHLGVSESHTAVEALAIPVLDNLLKFVTVDLLPKADTDDWLEADRSMERVRAGLGPIKDLVALRLDPISEQLKEYGRSTLACLSCARFTVMINGSEQVACALCGRTYGAASEAAWEYTGTDPYLVAKGRDSQLVYDCAECGGVAIRTAVASAPERESWVCFRYGCEIDGLCDFCGQAAHIVFEEAGLCQDCLDSRSSKF